MGRTLPIAGFVLAAVGICAATFASDEPLEKAATNTPAKKSAPNVPARTFTADDKDEAGIDLSKVRLREGTQLRDVTGRFRQSGDSLTFIDEDDRQISGLPNLNMERILRVLKTVEEPESIAWSVSGTVTEFAGKNYLLITRAVYKSAAPPPAPESLSK
ncbi:MAG: hypothetical protein H0T51_19245 [Pirellulales bacterium]|nr:hypothetical protein [Pirellulales bacterium]